MKISVLIEMLTCAKTELGDVEVVHHDDWDNFVVERIVLAPPASDPNGDHDPPHVLLLGERLISDCQGRYVPRDTPHLFTEKYEPPREGGV